MLDQGFQPQSQFVQVARFLNTWHCSARLSRNTIPIIKQGCALTRLICRSGETQGTGKAVSKQQSGQQEVVGVDEMLGEVQELVKEAASIKQSVDIAMAQSKKSKKKQVNLRDSHRRN